MTLVQNRYWPLLGKIVKAVLLCIIVCSLATPPQVALASEADLAVAESNREPAPNFIVEVFSNLFNSRGLMELLGRREYTVAAFITLNVIVFVETGLLIGFFLPGDSLLVTAGVIAAMSGWNVGLLILTLCLAAIIGDSVGYSIGFKAGPKIFCREKSLFFNKDHLLKAQQFYEKHGGKTIILARFIPLLRTFAPVVAGAGKMDYRRFLFYNIFGGIGWVCSMVLTGYFLTTLIDPLFKPVFGEGFEVRDHIEKVIVVVVFLSILPGILIWLLGKLKKDQKSCAPAVAEMK